MCRVAGFPAGDEPAFRDGKSVWPCIAHACCLSGISLPTDSWRDRLGGGCTACPQPRQQQSGGVEADTVCAEWAAGWPARWHVCLLPPDVPGMAHAARWHHWQQILLWRPVSSLPAVQWLTFCASAHPVDRARGLCFRLVHLSVRIYMHVCVRAEAFSSGLPSTSRSTNICQLRDEWWLSVWNEMQIVCVRLMPLPSQNPITSCLIKIWNDFTFLAWALPSLC